MRRARHGKPKPPREVPSSSYRSEVPSERKLSLRRCAGARTRVNVENKARSMTTSVKVPVPTPQDQDMKAEIGMTPEAFQKTLKGRKAEFKRNAEEKRLEGLKQIQNRNSRIGIHPLEQFPEEIWATLLEELCPEDRASMREVHPLFMDLIEDHRIRDKLFPLIVGFILPEIEKGFCGRYSLQCADETILNLRSVSKSVRNSVDKWIESRLFNDMRTEGNPLYLPRYKLEMTTYRKCINRPLVFSRGPLELRPKLFVWRALEIKLSPEYWERREILYHIGSRRQPQLEEDRGEMLRRDFMILRNNVLKMLETVGDQILFFQLTCKSMKEMEDLGLYLSQIYSFLKECLSLIPNVKWLKLEASGLPVKAKWITSASLVAQNHWMPTLAKLERADLYVKPSLVFPVWDSILAANPQVKYYTSYDIICRKYNDFARPAVLSLPLETVRLGRPERMIGLPLFQRISLSECNWNLQQLELNVNAMNDDHGLNSILQFLNKFPALEDLSLSINRINFVGGIIPLRLPNLKKLEVSVGPVVKLSKDEECLLFFFSLLFIFECVQLKELVWNNLFNDSSTLRPLLEQPLGNIIDFQGGLVDLRGSNVWDAFPALRRIALKFREKNSDGEMEFYSREYRNRKLVHEDNRELKDDK